MKNNQFALMLVGLFFVSATLNVWYCYRYVAAHHQLMLLQPEAVRMANARNFMAALFNDATEYGKKNPDLQRILQPYSAQPDALKPGSAATAAPAVKPSLK